MTTTVDPHVLKTKVQDMYRAVAENPHGEFHFEMGRGLAEKLGYQPADLDRLPQEAIESFAGVGYFFDLAALQEGERVLDLGSGSGMDVFFASSWVGSSGSVVGVDMTPEQLKKAEQLRTRYGFINSQFVEGSIEVLPVQSESFDIVISNGVINLSAEKEKVFQEIARVLKPGGRLAIADIVTEKPLTEKIVCDVTIWASCIGGAAQIDVYKKYIEDAGLEIVAIKENSTYEFLSKSARGATTDFGVKSISLLAKKK